MEYVNSEQSWKIDDSQKCGLRMCCKYCSKMNVGVSVTVYLSWCMEIVWIGPK